MDFCGLSFLLKKRGLPFADGSALWEIKSPFFNLSWATFGLPFFVVYGRPEFPSLVICWREHV